MNLQLSAAKILLPILFKRCQETWEQIDPRKPLVSDVTNYWSKYLINRKMRDEKRWSNLSEHNDRHMDKYFAHDKDSWIYAINSTKWCLSLLRNIQKNQTQPQAHRLLGQAPWRLSLRYLRISECRQSGRVLLSHLWERIWIYFAGNRMALPWRPVLWL